MLPEESCTVPAIEPKSVLLPEPVQVQGKLRGRITVPAEADADTMVAIATADPRIVELLEGKTIVKTIAVPGRMVNFVVR